MVNKVIFISLGDDKRQKVIAIKFEIRLKFVDKSKFSDIVEKVR